MCYFTAESNNRKIEFMRRLNTSNKIACSLSDKDLAEYIQFRKLKDVQKKFAVGCVGPQPDGSWVFSSHVHLDKCGKEIGIHDQRYVWIGDIFHGAGVAHGSEECSIESPLMSDQLCVLVKQLKLTMKHKFMPCVLTMAAVILTMHYQTMQRKLKYCPIPLIFETESGTGKTTALICGLSLFGAQESRFYSKLTKEKILSLCALSGVPLGVDDPQSKFDISRLLIDLYNGAKHGTVSHGEKTPLVLLQLTSHQLINKGMSCCWLYMHTGICQLK